MKNSNDNSKVIKSSLLAIIFTLFGSIFAYLIRVIYSRTLSIENYGLFYAVFGLFSILSTYADLGFGEAIAYFIPKQFKKKKYSELWNTFLYGQFIQIAVSVSLGIILALMAPFLAENYFKVTGSKNLIYIFCIFLVLNGFLNGINQIFTGLQKPNYFSTINTVKTFFILVLSLIAVFLNRNNINTYGLIWLVAYSVTVSIYLFLLWNRHSFLTENKLIKSRKFLEDLLKYAIPAFITTFIYSLMTASDLFFLTLYRGVVDVGIYNIIVPIASIGIIFLAPMHNILLPLTSSLMEGERKKLSAILTQLYKIIPFTGVYFGLFILMFPESIVSLIFGTKWVNLASGPLGILSTGYIFLLLGNLLGTIVLGMGRIRQRLKILSIIGIINIALDAFFISQFGLYGSVIMDSLISIVLVLVFTAIIRKQVNFKIDILFYMKMLTISGIIYTAAWEMQLRVNSIGALILAGVAYSLLFAFFGLYFKVYDKQTVRLFMKRGVND